MEALGRQLAKLRAPSGAVSLGEASWAQQDSLTVWAHSPRRPSPNLAALGCVMAGTPVGTSEVFLQPRANP